MSTKRILAWVLTLAMLMTFMPGFAIATSADDTSGAILAAEPIVTQSDTKENTNQAGGIVYTKTSTAKSDGTIDITLTAHTTGTVRQLTSVTPTDIVLVLDVSGSMKDEYDKSVVTSYEEVLGRSYNVILSQRTRYGFNNYYGSYYIKTGTAENPVYTRVRRTGIDDNGYEYFEYNRGNTEVYVYPELTSGTATNRSNNYPVFQFYSSITTTTTRSRMDVLKNAVNSFIDTTATMNEGLETDEMHTISIVKFADNSYYNSSTPTIVEGNNTGASGIRGYNYSEVVKGLTPVNAAGATALKSAVNELTPGGATAVDFGLKLAEAVLMNRSQIVEEGALDREEVVIVFTDGEPNHSSGFTPDVANTAILTANKMESTVGVTIYGVSVAPDANANDLNADINKFMHYVSSNYPNATSMTSQGEGGSIDNGYYMTPNDSTTLTMIFESIIQDIDHPTITMGKEATMVDTISPYFDFQGDVEKVKLQTSARNPDGTWAEPVDDNGLKANITKDRLTVDGFDFDANYVSETGRGDNKDFYGKRLVVSFTVVPDYGVIDAASANLMDGILPTNTGFASLVDSDSAPAAEVDTPKLEAHQVTYMVDGQEYTTYNRFTGSEIAVDAFPTKAGHTFSGWNYPAGVTISNGEFVMPDEDVTITGTFTPNRYNVTYAYSGVTPAGSTDLSGEQYNGNPANVNVAYGSTVNIAPNAEAPGYIFSGWRPLDQSVMVSEGSFAMPDHPVTLIGSFTPDNNTEYKIIHYLETFDDNEYTAYETENRTDTTDATAVAVPKYYQGFTFDEDNLNNRLSGTVAGDGSLVLELYYDRNSYDVRYSYAGDVPPVPPALPATQRYKYGQNVTVANNVEADGYTFGGWKSLTTDATAGESFTMPDHAIAFTGEFTANTDTEYEVRYYLENLEGNGYDLDSKSSYTNTGTTGSTVYANNKEFEGFIFDEDNDNNKPHGVILGDGSLVLELYYIRDTYTLNYAYEGNQPDEAPDISGWEPEEYRFGETVQVREDLYLEGYNFAGWHSTAYTVDNDTVEFAMPARDVTLYGDFEAADGVAWVEKHFFETVDGEYLDQPDYLFEHIGRTETIAVAEPIKEIPGFELDDGHDNYLPFAEIEGDGSTELRFYYRRLEYKVSYAYDPIDQPEGADELLPGEAFYRYGESVDIEATPSLAGYDFVGWYPEQSGVPYVGTFEMPAYNVVFEGDFNPRNDTVYEVHHHLQNADGTYPIEPNYKNEHTGTTGELVTAIPRYFTGYELATTDPVTGIVDAENTLILDLFYDRIEFNVTYHLTGLIPDAVTAPTDDDSPYPHGYEVTVLQIPDNIPDTYIFDGWNSIAQEAHEDVVVINDNKFVMPMHNVRLVGHFSAATNVPYTIRHLTQNEELDGYDIYLEEERTGATEEEVTVYALIIPGFTNITTDGNDILFEQSGQIPGVGTLIIDFYYDRNTHNITYQYEGITPAGTPSVPEAVNNVPFGKEVMLAAKPSIPGYTFSGWTTTDATVNEGKFNMPDNDVAFKGRFTSNKVDYTVNFWLQNLDAADTFNPDDYTLLEDVEGTGYTYKEEAYVGQLVQSRNQTFTGFALNQAESNWQDYVTVDEHGVGNLVLNLYFDRHTYNVTYDYYGEQPENAPDISDRNLTNVRYGTLVEVAQKPELEKYVFNGWYTRTATVTDNKFEMPDHDVQLLGLFTNQYTVNYDLNKGKGAEGVDYSRKTVDAGTVITVNAAPTRSGYKFDGWEFDDKMYDPDDNVTVDRDIVFVAKWTKKDNGGGNPGGGGITFQYMLTYETNGGNEIESEKYSANQYVKLKKVPVREGYVFDGWHIDAELKEDVDDVIMKSDITVYADWVKDNGNAGNGHETPDALNGEDHFAYVVGYPDGTVRPDDNITRAEVTSIFFRLLKPDEVRDNNLTTENDFNDVNAEDWFNTAISTMTKLGIVKGRYANEFVPDAYITRAEFATICARFDESEFEIVDDFEDVNGHWAEADIHEAAAHGWIRGYEDNTFKPDQYITRAEAMTMINRVLNRVPENADDLLDSMIKWPDNSDKSAWYYLPVQEATNSHEYEMKNHVYEKWTVLRDVADWTKYE